MALVGGPLCGTCKQNSVGRRYITYDGLGTNKVVLLGDSPWRNEIQEGIPFAGPAGKLLNRLIRRIGAERSDFIITNSMRCMPPTLGWTDDPRNNAAAEALHNCAPYLDELIEKFKPRCIVPMGNVALKRICGVTGINLHHAYVHDTSYLVRAVPTFHPSFIMQGNQKYSNAAMFALRRALEVAKGDFKRMPVKYLLDPPLSEARKFFEAWKPYMPLECDIETPKSGSLSEDEREEDESYTIIRIGFSFKPGEAITMPWAEPYVSLCKEVLKDAKITYWWNEDYDKPRLRANGVSLPGRSLDGMWAWHFLQSDLPKGLGFVAPFYFDGPSWKHLSDVQPAFYNAVDLDAQIRATQGVIRDLKREGRWEAFQRHCVQTKPILDIMGSKGVLVDREQQGAFKDKLQEEYDRTYGELQGEVPRELKPSKPYKRNPNWLLKWGRTQGWEFGARNKELTQLEYPLEEIEKELNLVPAEDGEHRWIKFLDFNPNSSPQVATLAKHYGIKLPKNPKGKTDKESTEAKFLKRAARKQKVFRKILDCRQRQKLITTYIWNLSDEGKVFTHYGFHPSTWRKSSRNVNLQNIPKRSDLAKKFREMLIASPGHVLMEADASAIEAVLVGYCARSPEYIELARAGVHGWLTAHHLGSPIPTDISFNELKALCTAMKYKDEAAYDRCKRVCHLSNYKGTPNRIYEEYPDDFSSVAEARALQDAYWSLPQTQAILKWHREVMERAHKESYLDNHFFYRHRFFNIFQWRNGKWEAGNDAKRAIAFIPQSDASAIQTEILLQLAEDEQIMSWLRLIIHDSFVLEVPENKVDYCAQKVYSAMVQPWPQLGGLSIGAEVSVGKSLGSMKSVEVGG